DALAAELEVRLALAQLDGELEGAEHLHGVPASLGRLAKAARAVAARRGGEDRQLHAAPPVEGSPAWRDVSRYRRVGSTSSPSRARRPTSMRQSMPFRETRLTSASRSTSPMRRRTRTTGRCCARP